MTDMKLYKSVSCLTLILLTTQLAFFQEAPKSVLIDEIEGPNCEDTLVRTENFMIALRNDPSAVGYAVISGMNKNPMSKLAYEHWIKARIKDLRFDPSRLVIIRSTETGERRYSFWLVPAGAEKPEFNEIKWNFALSPATTPFLVHDDNEQICSSAAWENTIVEFLEANPASRSNVLIYARSPRSFEKQKKDTLTLFPMAYRNRFKFFYERYTYDSREFWIVSRAK